MSLPKIKIHRQDKTTILISNITITFFKFIHKNAQIRRFLSQIQSPLFPHKTLHFNRFEGAGFKYDNSFFQIPFPKYPNNVFLILNIIFFLFAKNFAFRLIRGC